MDNPALNRLLYMGLKFDIYPTTNIEFPGSPACDCLLVVSCVVELIGGYAESVGSWWNAPQANVEDLGQKKHRWVQLQND